MKRNVTWLQLMIAVLVVILGLLLAIRTEGLSRPRQQVALIGGFLMIVIATAAFEIYARRVLHRESQLFEPVGRSVARAIINAVSLAWLSAAGFLFYLLASHASSPGPRIAAAALAFGALAGGWALKRRLKMDSLLPYALSTLAAILLLAFYILRLNPTPVR